MRILLVAATEAEVGGLIDLGQKDKGERIKEKGSQNSNFKIQNFSESLHLLENIHSSKPKAQSSILHTSHLLITGVGMVATALALGRHLANNEYDMAINLGIAGSFDRDIALGDVLEITEDHFAELGAEDDEAFLGIGQLGFGESTYYSTTTLFDYFKEARMQRATAITVNTVHGNTASIEKLSKRLKVQLESMEGAAFFYACKQFNLPCMQIRAVSNYVEKRNREAWKIGLAIKNLNTFAMELLQNITDYNV